MDRLERSTPGPRARAPRLCVMIAACGVLQARVDSAHASNAQAADARPSVDCFARVARKVVDHVWVIEKPAPTDAPFEGNVVVIEQADGLVVLDAGGSPRSGENVVREIRALSAKPVKVLAYTHYHGDHNLGAGAIVAAWPNVVIVSTARTREHMTGAPMEYIHSYGSSYGETAVYAGERARDTSLGESERAGWSRFASAGPCMREGYANLRAVPAAITFTDRFVIHDEKAPVELVFLGRANTDGDALAWLPKQRVLATGDVVVHPIPYASACYPREWIDVLAKISAFDYAYLVPGHGEVQTDKDYVAKLVRVLTELRAAIQPLAKLELDEARKRLDLSGLRRIFVADEDGWGRVLFSNVFLNAIVSNAWREARGEPIEQGREGG